jgi:site-specific DNA-methyltransferase (adenine-specific)
LIFGHCGANIAGLLNRGGAIALFAQLPYAADVINANRDWFRYDWIWEKSCAVGFLNANRMPLRAHENILIFYDGLPTFNPQKTAGESYATRSGNHKTSIYGRYKPIYKTINADGQRYPRDVINFAREQHTIHTAQKPVKLCEYLILTYTDPGETVLDNCMGSGSTGVACVNTGRNFIGIELDEKIFDMAKKRIEDSVQGNLFYADFSE